VDTLSEELQKLEAANSVSDRDTIHFEPLVQKEGFLFWLIVIAFFTYPFWLFNLFITVSDTLRYFEYKNLIWVSTPGEIYQVTSSVQRRGPASYSCDFTFYKSKILFQSLKSCTEIVENLPRDTEFSEMESIRYKGQGASIQLTKRVPITVYYEKSNRRIEITRDDLSLPNPSKPGFPDAAWILFFAALAGIGLAYHVLTRDRPQPPEPAESFR
jgi:hypothetical protein